MTAQSMETIYIDGEKHYMATEPFGDYLEKLEATPKLSPPNTACWRGYYGKWKIRDEKLYLTGLEACIDANEKTKEIGLDYFFPDQKQVLAEWFSGEIRVPMGEMLKYVHLDYYSIYEKDLIIKIDKGVVIQQTMINNSNEPDKQ